MPTPRSVNEAGSGAADEVVAVKVEVAGDTLVRMNKPLVVGKAGIAELKIAVPLAGPTDVFSSYVENAAFRVARMAEPAPPKADGSLKPAIITV
jgi:hypothetical protein